MDMRRFLIEDDNAFLEEAAALSFFAEGQFFVERLIPIIQRLRKRDDIGAEKLQSLAIPLRASERLTMVTDGLSVRIMLINTAANGDWGYFSFFLCFEELELVVGESIDYGIGREHQVLNNLKIGLGWRGHDGIETGWDEWLDEFARHADDQTIEVSIEDDDSYIDRDASTSGAEVWDALQDGASFKQSPTQSGFQ